MAENLEQDIARLEQELAQKKASLEQQHGVEELPSEKEILHEVVKERIQTQVAQTSDISAPVSPSVPANSFQESEIHATVQQLITVALTKSLDQAILEASKTHNAAVIDAFHDAIVDELYSELVARQKVVQPS